MPTSKRKRSVPKRPDDVFVIIRQRFDCPSDTTVIGYCLSESDALAISRKIDNDDKYRECDCYVFRTPKLTSTPKLDTI